MADLPPAQLYIILGIVATACAILSTRLTREENPPTKLGIVILCLFFVSSLAVAPIFWQLKDVIDNKWDDNGTLKTNFEATWMYMAHGLSILGMFFMAVSWYARLTRMKFQLRQTSGIRRIRRNIRREIKDKRKQMKRNKKSRRARI